MAYINGKEILFSAKIGGGSEGGITPTGTKTIIENGTYDVTEYASAKVNVRQPSGTIEITKNGTHAVYAYAEAEVNVPIPEGYIKPKGTTTLTNNGTYNIADKEYVSVNVPQNGGGGITPTGTIKITENGLHSVAVHSMADVQVPIAAGYIVPEGETTITENGKHDVTEYASVDVDVPIPEGYIVPEGTLDIVEGGEHNVAEYEKVNVNVPIPEVKLQTKTATPTTEEQTIEADDGYDGLGAVEIGAIQTEEKTITTNGEHSPSNGKYFSKVTVAIEGNDVKLQEQSVAITENKTIDVTPENGYDGLSKVTVSVNVPIPEGYVKPEDEMEITENDEYDVTSCKKVTVNVPMGTDTSDADATGADMLEGKTAYVDGVKITGTIPTKTESDITVIGRTVSIPSGYYASDTSKSISTTTQATPSISVSDDGLITAKTTQIQGYVPYGTKSATKQLDAKGAETFTPTTADQTITKGQYLTGDQIIKGDSNLKPEIIKKDEFLFGIKGTYEGMSVSDTNVQVVPSSLGINQTMPTYLLYQLTDGKNVSGSKYVIMETPITPEIIKKDEIVVGVRGTYEDESLDKYFEGGCETIDLPKATQLKPFAFYQDKDLVNISMPNVTSIGKNAFHDCSSLALTSLPASLVTIREYAFYKCSKLALTELPSGVMEIGSRAFWETGIAITEIPSSVSVIGDYAFWNCNNLKTVTFKGKPTSIGANAFGSLTNLNVPWAEGEVAGAPWGATMGTINYNYTEG